MFLSVRDLGYKGYITKKLGNSSPKSKYKKDVLEKNILNLLKSGDKKDKLIKLVSFLGPELRAEAKKSLIQNEKVKTLVTRFWRQSSYELERLDTDSHDENVNILRTLHQQRAFYLLEEMRVKLGNESFIKLLKEATEYDIELLKLLAYAQEDQLLSSYLHAWESKDLFFVQNLNIVRYLHTLAYHNCTFGIQTFLKIAKGAISLNSYSQRLSNSTVLKQALKPDILGETPLHIAALSGNPKAVRLLGQLLTTDALIERVLQPNQKDLTPLHLAAMSGNAETVRAVWELLTTDAQKEQALKANWRCSSLLHLAAKSGNAEAVQAVWKLLTTDSQKEQALKATGSGHTPLHLAAKSGNAEAIGAVWKLLTTDAQKEQNLQPDMFGQTPLHYAADSGNAEAVRAVWKLLTTDSQKEQALKSDVYGYTPLHLVARRGNAEAVRTVWKLLTTDPQKKQALKEQDSGKTLLHFAAESGNIEAVRAVWEVLTTDLQKEQASKTCVIGYTPLHYAAKSGNAEAVRAVWELLTTPALKEQALNPSIFGQTLLHLAAASGNAEVVRVVWELLTTPVLKEQALNPDRFGQTPLHLAAKYGKAKAVRIVRQLLTTPDQKNKALNPNLKGRTPLYYAVKTGKTETLRAVGELYTPSLLLVTIMSKSSRSKLNDKNLEQLLSIYPDSSQEKRLIESELRFRKGEKQELSDKWTAWLRDSDECRKELLPLILLQHEEMAEILLESLGDIPKEALQIVLNKNISYENKLSFLHFFPPELARRTVDQAPEEILSQAKERQVALEDFRGSAQDALSYMRTQWANHIRENSFQVLLDSLQKGLAAFPPITLAALAHDPKTADHLIHFLTACSDRQLSVVIPQLHDDLFREAMKHCTDLRLYLLEKATEEQKQIYLLEFEKDLGYQEWRRGYEGLKSQNPTLESLAHLQNQTRVLHAQISRLKKKIYTSESYVGNRIRWQESLDKLKEGFNKIKKAKRKAAELESKNIPEEFVCPLSGEIMKDPVKSPSEHVFDRTSIEKWLTSSHTNPFTREHLNPAMLTPVSDLKEKIAAWNDVLRKPESNSE